MTLQLQVDGGQKGRIDVYRLSFHDGTQEKGFGWLAATGPAGDRVPTIGEKETIPDTEYWFFDPDRWSELVRCYGDLGRFPDLRVQFDYQGEQDDFTPPTKMTASYAAPEGTTWQDASGATWPAGTLAFSAGGSTDVVRGVGFLPGTDGAASVFWALADQVMITRAMLSDKRFCAAFSTTGARWYAVSNLRTLT